MKKLLLVLLLLLLFTMSFSKERDRMTQLEDKVTELGFVIQSQQNELKTQKELIDRQFEVIKAYEGTEKGLDSKIIANASLNYNVDQFYTTAWNKLENHLDRGLSAFMWIIGLAFAGIGLLLPYFQNKSMNRTLDKIDEHDDKLNDYDLKFKEYQSKIDTQQTSLESQQSTLDYQQKSLNSQQELLNQQNDQFFIQQKSFEGLRDHLLRQNKELVDSKKSFEKYVDEQKEIIADQNAELEKTKDIISNQQLTIEKDLEEHKKMERSINKALGEVSYLNGNNYYETLKKSTKDNYLEHLDEYLWWLINSTNYYSKGSLKDNQILGDISWNFLEILKVFLVNSNNKLEFKEEEIIEAIQKNFSRYLQSEEKIKDGIDQIIDERTDEWTKEKIDRIKRILK